MDRHHRLFLDANVLFSAAYHAHAPMTRLWEHQVELTKLLTSPYAVEEARRNLGEAAALDRLEKLLTKLEVASDVLTGELPAEMQLPDKDRPIFLSAVDADATHLLTGDRAHFGKYFSKVIQGVRIESPGDYLRSAPR